LGKARDVSESIAKAVDDAKKSLVKVPIIKGTIPHEQKGKFGAGKVFIKPASDGTGVIAGGAMRAVLEIAGVHNVLAKAQGSSNPHNVVKATVDALMKLRSAGQIAKARGIPLTKVYEG
jgi:small subunit ribosomal protein S5